MEPVCAQAQPDDAMSAEARQRPTAIRVVIPFVFRHWLNQPVRAMTVAGGLLGATVADLFMPLFSGHLVPYKGEEEMKIARATLKQNGVDANPMRAQ